MSAHTRMLAPASAATTLWAERVPALSFETPVGTLTVTETGNAITRISWAEGATDETPLLKKARDQIAAYFDGDLVQFDLPLHVKGSNLQRQVCQEMRAITLGETRTYGDLAKTLDVPAQAIGQACGGNPIPIVIPCHRVLGASSLGGFSGGVGIDTKVALLKHEGAAALLI